MSDNQTVRTTALYDLHLELGAKMVEFAAYSMPLQYSGIIEEHLHTRSSAGLFDVSHMGQISVYAASFEKAAKELERVLSADIQTLEPGTQRYSLILNEKGGIVDDCMVARLPLDVSLQRAQNEYPLQLHIVVNASRKAVDFAHIRSHCDESIDLIPREDRALLALQGQSAVGVLQKIEPKVKEMTFMQVEELVLDGAVCFVSRSGYTGEDGYEISVPIEAAKALAQNLLSDERVRPVGLGARDSLRLEAGMPLYGNDIDQDTTPIEAGLTFAVGKNQRLQANFLGAGIILTQLTEKKVPKKRVGLTLNGRLPARQGNEVLLDGKKIGMISSGLYSPSLEYPIAMAYVPQEFSKVDTELEVLVRSHKLLARVTKLPFVAPRYAR